MQSAAVTVAVAGLIKLQSDSDSECAHPNALQSTEGSGKGPALQST